MSKVKTYAVSFIVTVEPGTVYIDATSPEEAQKVARDLDIDDLLDAAGNASVEIEETVELTKEEVEALELEAVEEDLMDGSGEDDSETDSEENPPEPSDEEE